MKARLVAITKGVGELEGLSAEEIISFVARVSNPTNQLNLDTAPKLLGYCIEHKHWSIFETAYMTIEIETSRAIAAQIIRHTFKIQEFSQRYSKPYSFELYEARRQDKKNRQNSIDDLPQETKDWFDKAQQSVWDLSYGLYEEGTKLGIAKECLRFLLPLNTTTRMYLTTNCRGWIHYLQVRAKEQGTQLEHAEIAEACKKIFIEQFPNTSSALEWN